VPKAYAFETAYDYKAHESYVVTCVDWLVDIPMFQNPSKRRESQYLSAEVEDGKPAKSIEC
jgi:hypothetical protein